MEEALPIIFLAVVLKIPVFGMLWLIWWAMRAEPELEDTGGTEDHSFRRWRLSPSKPRNPRLRGPHGGAAQAQPDCPPGGRTRTPVIEPRIAPGAAAHERRDRAPAGT